jgi:hypothetical protein
MREGDSWEKSVMEGRGGEENVQSNEDLRITPEKKSLRKK